MAITSGVADCIQVGDDFAFVMINEVGGGNEAFIIWFAPQNQTAYQRVLQNTWLGLFKQSLTGGNTVRITHADDSAFIQAVRLDSLS